MKAKVVVSRQLMRMRAVLQHKDLGCFGVGLIPWTVLVFLIFLQMQIVCIVSCCWQSSPGEGWLQRVVRLSFLLHLLRKVFVLCMWTRKLHIKGSFRRVEQASCLHLSRLT